MAEAASVQAMGLMARLRAHTSEQHTQAERKDLQQRMVQGRLTREEYAAWLGQMLHVHRALARGVDAARARGECNALTPVHTAGQHVANIESDLGHFGVAPGAALGATGAIVRDIEAAAHRSAFELLGMYYVLEGSMNGNAFIARAVGGGLGLTSGEGLKYLTPYGARQREVWAEFKREADALRASEADIQCAECGAARMFEGVAQISDALVSVP